MRFDFEWPVSIELVLLELFAHHSLAFHVDLVVFGVLFGQVDLWERFKVPV
jgi:hypothetical protein